MRGNFIKIDLKEEKKMIREKIEKILDTEKESEEIIKKAQADALKIEKNAIKQIEEFQEQIINEVQLEAKKIKEETKKRVSEEVSRLEKGLKKELSELENSAGMKRDKAIEYILNRIQE